mmetsp:Transcript_38427/g.57976  ORF Transcript_38427/g.57976 Transcript_38427/m.57976 type:complete len:82 (-) Transcript_38427:75-320(-)
MAHGLSEEEMKWKVKGYACEQCHSDDVTTAMKEADCDPPKLLFSAEALLCSALLLVPHAVYCITLSGRLLGGSNRGQREIC